MDTRFLESLIAVVETGSIAGAARTQGLTAAAVSQRIRVLETELDCTLLNRSTHAALPTRACLQLLPSARNLVRDAGQLSARADAGGLRGPYRLGAVSTALVDYGPAVIQAFRSRAPEATLTIRPGTSRSLYEDLNAGALDAALIVAPPFPLPKSMHCRPIAEQEAVHLVPRAAELPSSGADGLPWIIYDREAWGGRLIWEAYGALFGEGHILCELDGLETIALMVANGSGQAIVPNWPGLSDQTSRLKVLPLEKRATRRMVLAHSRSSLTSALSDLVFSSLLETADT